MLTLHTIFDPAIDLTSERTDMGQFARWRDPSFVAARGGQKLASFRCRPLPTQAASELLSAVSEPAKAMLAFRACVVEVLDCSFASDREGVVQRLYPSAVDGVEQQMWPTYLWSEEEVVKTFPLAVVQDIGACVVQQGFFGRLYAARGRRAYVLPPLVLPLLDAAFRLAAADQEAATSADGETAQKGDG